MVRGSVVVVPAGGAGHLLVDVFTDLVRNLAAGLHREVQDKLKRRVQRLMRGFEGVVPGSGPCDTSGMSGPGTPCWAPPSPPACRCSAALRRTRGRPRTSTPSPPPSRTPPSSPPRTVGTTWSSPDVLRGERRDQLIN